MGLGRISEFRRTGGFMKSKYFIIKIAFGIVNFIDDDLKLRKMDIDNYKKFCCTL